MEPKADIIVRSAALELESVYALTPVAKAVFVGAVAVRAVGSATKALTHWFTRRPEQGATQPTQDPKEVQPSQGTVSAIDVPTEVPDDKTEPILMAVSSHDAEGSLERLLQVTQMNQQAVADLLVEGTREDLANGNGNGQKPKRVDPQPSQPVQNVQSTSLQESPKEELFSDEPVPTPTPGSSSKGIIVEMVPAGKFGRNSKPASVVSTPERAQPADRTRNGFSDEAEKIIGNTALAPQKETEEELEEDGPSESVIQRVTEAVSSWVNQLFARREKKTEAAPSKAVISSVVSALTSLSSLKARISGVAKRSQLWINNTKEKVMHAFGNLSQEREETASPVDVKKENVAQRIASRFVTAGKVMFSSLRREVADAIQVRNVTKTLKRAGSFTLKKLPNLVMLGGLVVSAFTPVSPIVFLIPAGIGVARLAYKGARVWLTNYNSAYERYKKTLKGKTTPGAIRIFSSIVSATIVHPLQSIVNTVSDVFSKVRSLGSFHKAELQKRDSVLKKIKYVSDVLFFNVGGAIAGAGLGAFFALAINLPGPIKTVLAAVAGVSEAALSATVASFAGKGYVYGAEWLLQKIKRDDKFVAAGLRMAKKPMMLAAAAVATLLTLGGLDTDDGLRSVANKFSRPVAVSVPERPFGTLGQTVANRISKEVHPQPVATPVQTLEYTEFFPNVVRAPKPNSVAYLPRVEKLNPSTQVEQAPVVHSQATEVSVTPSLATQSLIKEVNRRVADGTLQRHGGVWDLTEQQITGIAAERPDAFTNLTPAQLEWLTDHGKDTYKLLLDGNTTVHVGDTLVTVLTDGGLSNSAALVEQVRADLLQHAIALNTNP